MPPLYHQRAAHWMSSCHSGNSACPYSGGLAPGEPDAPDGGVGSADGEHGVGLVARRRIVVTHCGQLDVFQDDLAAAVSPKSGMRVSGGGPTSVSPRRAAAQLSR